MAKSSSSRYRQFEIIGFILILINAIIFLYFIFKLNQIESLARETQAQAQEIIRSLDLDSLDR
jgi:hypothetical protein